MLARCTALTQCTDGLGAGLRPIGCGWGCERAGRSADGGVDPMGRTSRNAEMAGGCATAIAVKVAVRDECDESGGEHSGAE